MQILCPCHSGKIYEYCCKSFHDGKLAPTAVLLMRSRYTAYAIHHPKYIIQTTHKDNPNYQFNKQIWIKEILLFARIQNF